MEQKLPATALIIETLAVGVVSLILVRGSSGLLVIVLPFAAGEHKKVAVKVIDAQGNEVMRVMGTQGIGLSLIINTRNALVVLLFIVDTHG